MERTWIVVCDASHCRFFMKRQNTTEWVKFEEFEHPAGRAKGMDLISDRAGRYANTQAKGRTHPAMDLRTTPEEVEEQRFSHKIAEMLESAYNQNAFERLILVAPPQFLGALRDALKGPVTRVIYGTLDKDYTKLRDDQLPERIATP